MSCQVLDYSLFFSNFEFYFTNKSLLFSILRQLCNHLHTNAMRKFILFITLQINLFPLFGQPILTISDAESLKKIVQETVFFDDKIGDKTLQDVQQAPSVFEQPKNSKTATAN